MLGTNVDIGEFHNSFINVGDASWGEIVSLPSIDRAG